MLAPYVPSDALPTVPAVSCAVCERHLPKEHELPEFFRVRTQAGHPAGAAELEQAYNDVHEDYDDFWTVEASAPVRELIQRLAWHGTEKVFEAGCSAGWSRAIPYCC